MLNGARHVMRRKRAASISLIGLFILLMQTKDSNPKGGSGYCSFPSFLWRSASSTGGSGDDVEYRQWISRTEYIDRTDTWKKQKVIVAMETEISVSNKMHAHCSGISGHDPVPCFRQEIHRRILCISEEPDEKFRTQIILNDKTTFSCIRLVKRSSAIIQIYQAVHKDINEDRLCYDVSLQRNEWPWIDPYSVSHLPCSISGGFEFRAFLGETRERFCASGGRLSLLEAECPNEDGPLFQFAHENCNAFEGFGSEKKLFCVAQWSEEQFLFLILIDDKANRLPRFVLRFPRSYHENSTASPFLATLYFSVVAPLSGRGTPPGGVTFAQMEMTGRTSVHELSSILKAECNFSSEYYGLWVSFSGPSLYYFVIEHGQITSNPSMGKLICKGRHWVSSSYFKVAAIGNDGCWLRYCCLHLSIRDRVIQSRLSGCSRIDKSFDSCRISHSDMNDNSIFRENDVQKPGNDSGLINNLISASSVQMRSCDFGDVLETEVLFSDGTRCSGTLRDVDVINSSCILRPSVEFNLTACQHDVPNFYCVASIRLSSGKRLLVTNTTKRSALQCWVVKRRLDGLRPTHNGMKKLSFILNRCHCNSGEIIEDAIVGSTFSTTNAELSAIEAFHADSETCKERLEVGVLIKNSNSTQNRTPVLFHYNLTNQSLVQGHSLHDLNSHHLSSRKRKEHAQTSDAKDDDSVASFSNRNDSTVHLVTLTFLFWHFAFTLFSNDAKCYAVNFVL